MKSNLRKFVSAITEAPACSRPTPLVWSKTAPSRRSCRWSFPASWPAFALAGLALLSAGLLCAQVPWGYAPPPGGPTPNTAMAQQNAQRTVQSQVGWFQNGTRTASRLGDGGYGALWQQFQALRTAYSAFRATLNQQQLAGGANEMAELEAGLDILQEAFSNYRQEVADGQSSGSAFNEMCQVLYQASGVWLQEFNSDCSRLRVGWR